MNFAYPAIVRLLVPLLLCAGLVTSCAGDDKDGAVLPATATAAIESIYEHEPPNAAGLTIRELLSPVGGGQFDCTSPDLISEPMAITHSRVDSVATGDTGELIIEIHYFNEPETISQAATFAINQAGDISPLDDHARTFLDPSVPSVDTC